MQKTINTLSEIIKKYRAKNLRQPDLSQKLAEDLINTIGIHKLDSVTIVKDFLMSKYINVSVGDSVVREQLVDDLIHLFDKAGAEIKGDLEMPSGLHEIEQPLSREDVVNMYKQTPVVEEAPVVDEKQEKIQKPKKKVTRSKKTNVRRNKVAKGL